MDDLKQQIIEFYNLVAISNAATIENPDPIASVERMKQTEAESLMDSMISKIAQVGEGATTAQYEEYKRQRDGREEVDFVGQKRGTLRKKTGNIVIVHAARYSRIEPKTVMVYKDRDISDTAAEKIPAEAGEVIANREANVCFYLFSTEEQMPACFSSVKIGDKFVIASCDMNPSLLVCITKLAGWICRLKTKKTDTDAYSTSKELRNISLLLEELPEIQKLTQLVSQHSIKISEKFSILKEKIERCVIRTIDSLEKSYENRNYYIPEG